MQLIVRIPSGVDVGPARKSVLGAYVTPQEIRDHLEHGWRAYSVEDITSDQWTGGGIPIPARAPIGPDQVRGLEQYRESELQVVFIPEELAERREELFDAVMAAVARERAEHKKSRRWNAKRAQYRAERLVCQCIALVQNLQRIPVSTHHVTSDPIVVQLLTECKEALGELVRIMGPIDRDLLSGSTKRLGELRGLPPIDDQSAHCAFRYAVDATLYLHHIALLLGLKIPGATKLFLAALFINTGLLARGDIMPEDHAAWSAYIYELLREQKPSLPSDVADLIRDHGQWWPWNAGVRVVIDNGTGSPTSQRRVYGPNSGIRASVVLPNDKGTVAVQPMDRTYIALVLILSVVEQVVDRSIQGESEVDALSDLVERMQTNGYSLGSCDTTDQSMLAWVLAAAANAHKVKPRRAVVAFGKKGDVPGGRPIAISLGYHEEPSDPLVLVVTREGSGVMFSHTPSIRTTLQRSKASLRTDTTQLLLGLGTEPESSIWRRAGNPVVGFVSEDAFQIHCREVQSRLGRILPQLKELR